MRPQPPPVGNRPNKPLSVSKKRHPPQSKTKNIAASAKNKKELIKKLGSKVIGPKTSITSTVGRTKKSDVKFTVKKPGSKANSPVRKKEETAEKKIINEPKKPKTKVGLIVKKTKKVIVKVVKQGKVVVKRIKKDDPGKNIKVPIKKKSEETPKSVRRFLISNLSKKDLVHLKKVNVL
jgi:hypothetical protein